MTQPTIGQRLYELFHRVNFGQETYIDITNEASRQNHTRIATELIRGVLTGEIPLPEELISRGYFVGHINPESITCCNEKAATNEQLGYKFTLTSDHIPDATK